MLSLCKLSVFDLKRRNEYVGFAIISRWNRSDLSRFNSTW